MITGCLQVPTVNSHWRLFGGHSCKQYFPTRNHWHCWCLAAGLEGTQCKIKSRTVSFAGHSGCQRHCLGSNLTHSRGRRPAPTPQRRTRCPRLRQRPDHRRRCWTLPRSDSGTPQMPLEIPAQLVAAAASPAMLSDGKREREREREKEKYAIQSAPNISPYAFNDCNGTAPCNCTMR